MSHSRLIAFLLLLAGLTPLAAARPPNVILMFAPKAKKSAQISLDRKNRSDTTKVHFYRKNPSRPQKTTEVDFRAKNHF